METARLIADLNDAQRQAVTTAERPLRILAGAGSGKTRVLTRRIAHRCATGDADPRHVLALTFTRKAAGELRDRLRHLGLRDAVAAGTFHGVAWSQLQARWADRGIRPPELLTSRYSAVQRALPPAIGRDRAAVLDVIGEMEWAIARLVDPGGYTAAADAAGRRCPVDPAVVDRAWAGYVEHKRQRRRVDFDDLLALWRRDLVNDPDAAAVARWRFRHVFVDEFQDVNPAQHALLQALLGESRDLCVVGDPNQAIYAWNGADAQYLVHFERWWPGGGSVRLVDNYRSTPQVLRAANAVLRAAAGAHAEAAALVPHRPDGPDPTVTAHADDTAEAAAVARRVRDRHRPGGRWGRQAVLVRTNAQLALLEQALRRGSIPCRVRGGGALLDQPEVRTALGAARRHQGTFEALIDELDATAARLGGPDGDGGPPPDDDAVADSRAGNLEALARLARDYRDLGGTPTAVGFVQWLAEFARSDLHDPGGDAVDLLTFHAAKGLEWPVVHLAGVEDGLVPIGHAKSREALAEERRLFYVALTRAQEELHCTWAEQRTFRDRPANRRPSPYLAELQGRAPATAPTPVGSRRGAAGVPKPRAPLPHDLTEADRPVFEALRAWRAELARGARTPAFVIANDETLRMLAARRPRSTAELAAIRGLGPSKIARYGDALLAIVADADAGGGPASAATADADAPVSVRAGASADDPDAGGDTADPTLIAALRAWRLDAARSADVPAYRVLTDRALHDVAARRPSSAAELLEVHGIGPSTANRFGEAILEVVAEHADATTA